MHSWKGLGGEPLDQCFPRDAAGEMCSVVVESMWGGMRGRTFYLTALGLFLLLLLLFK